MGWMLPLVQIDRIAASAKSNVLVSRTKGEFGSQYLSSGALVNVSLMVLKAASYSVVQFQDVVFQVRWVSGNVSAE